jgi:hypothetical protein
MMNEPRTALKLWDLRMRNLRMRDLRMRDLRMRDLRMDGARVLIPRSSIEVYLAALGWGDLWANEAVRANGDVVAHHTFV